MKIFIGGDHAGFEMKEELKKYLATLQYEVEDIGPHRFNPNDDYPDFVIPLAKAVTENPDSRGIVVAGSGEGEIMCANKIEGIRAALVYDSYSARISREHNDANIMAIGARTMDVETAKRLVKIWLETPFSYEERHIRRLRKIAELEQNLQKTERGMRNGS
jgi:ribose 5-phosphate isomerase B